MTTATAPLTLTTVVDAAAAALGRYAALPGEARRSQRPDPGPALFAALAARHPAASEAAGAALSAWLRDNGPVRAHPGLFETGLAGHWLALRTAADVWPQLGGVAAAAGTALHRLLTAEPWAADRLGWTQYDLISGPAGTALVGVALDEPEVTAAAVRRLVALCGDPELRDLVVRQYEDEPLRGWNHGKVNTGLAHGVAGVVAALAAVPASAPTADALRTAAWWLVRRSRTTGDGLIGWPVGIAPAGTAPASAISTGHRLSWCYGTPGVSLALWRAGVALDEVALRDFAVDAFRSFVATCDSDRQQNGLGLCCGAVGVALIGDAFHRHAGLAAAADLRDHLLGRLHGGLDELVDDAANGCGLLSGPGGTFAGLLALTSDDSADPAGAARSWLPAIGLPS